VSTIAGLSYYITCGTIKINELEIQRVCMLNKPAE